jgi:hypothetical protein
MGALSHVIEVASVCLVLKVRYLGYASIVTSERAFLVTTMQNLNVSAIRNESRSLRNRKKIFNTMDAMLPVTMVVIAK